MGDRWLQYYRLIVSSFAFNTIETVCFGGLRIFWMMFIIAFSYLFVMSYGNWVQGNRTLVKLQLLYNIVN